MTDEASTRYWWRINVTHWGTIILLGTPAQAEDWRGYKAKWEQATARKLRLRAASLEEIAALHAELPTADFESRTFSVDGDDRVPDDVLLLAASPGSSAAHKRGCICARIDNAMGDGIPRDGRKTFSRRLDCPFHDSEEKVALG